MSKHTPGPLESVNNLIRTSMACGGFLVAECRDGNGCPFGEEAESNARLFAAAPELLELLSAFVNYDSSQHDDTSLLDNNALWEAAEYTIAKATGSA